MTLSAQHVVNYMSYNDSASGLNADSIDFLSRINSHVYKEIVVQECHELSNEVFSIK